MPARSRVTSRLRSFSRTLRGDLTDGERRLWGYIRDRRLNGWKFKRQHPIGRYIADFVCAEAWLIVEIDGSQHARTRVEDAQRTAALAALGYRVIRFSASDAVRQTDVVLRTILGELKTPSP